MSHMGKMLRSVLEAHRKCSLPGLAGDIMSCYLGPYSAQQMWLLVPLLLPVFFLSLSLMFSAPLPHEVMYPLDKYLWGAYPSWTTH